MGAAKAGPRGRGAKPAAGRMPGAATIRAGSLSAVGAGAAATAEIRTDATFIREFVQLRETEAKNSTK